MHSCIAVKPSSRDLGELQEGAKVGVTLAAPVEEEEPPSEASAAGFPPSDAADEEDEEASSHESASPTSTLLGAPFSFGQQFRQTLVKVADPKTLP